MQTRIGISRNTEIIRKCKKDVNQDKDGEDVPKLESVKVTFVPNKQLGQLINIVPHS